MVVEFFCPEKDQDKKLELKLNQVLKSVLEIFNFQGTAASLCPGRALCIMAGEDSRPKQILRVE